LDNEELNIIEEDEQEEFIDIAEDLSQLSVFGEDPVWRVPIVRRIPDPTTATGFKAYRLFIPVKMLTQAEILAAQTGMNLKGGRNIVDEALIKRWSKSQAKIFTLAVQRAGGKIKFTVDPRGQANYAAGELSVNDLSYEDMKRLEAIVTPGMNKSAEAIEDEARVSSRSAGKAPKKPKRRNIPEAGTGEDTGNTTPAI
jgi:hypothetical protein